jgi:hypothetical protein
MKIIIKILLGVVGIYLLLVIPAGIAVWVKEYNFNKSPDRDDILNIIKEYKEYIIVKTKPEIILLTENTYNNVVKRSNKEYNVQAYAKKDGNNKSYKIYISVGRNAFVTIGHAEIFDISY